MTQDRRPKVHRDADGKPWCNVQHKHPPALARQEHEITCERCWYYQTYAWG